MQFGPSPYQNRTGPQARKHQRGKETRRHEKRTTALAPHPCPPAWTIVQIWMEAQSTDAELRSAEVSAQSEAGWQSDNARGCDAGVSRATAHALVGELRSRAGNHPADGALRSCSDARRSVWLSAPPRGRWLASRGRPARRSPWRPAGPGLAKKAYAATTRTANPAALRLRIRTGNSHGDGAESNPAVLDIAPAAAAATSLETQVASTGCQQ